MRDVYHPINSDVKPIIGEIVIATIRVDNGEGVKFLDPILCIYTGKCFMEKISLIDITDEVQSWASLP
jgi:hypothetical protein